MMRVICDIGGTHIRLAGDNGGADPLAPLKYPVAQFSDLADAVAHYLSESGIAKKADRVSVAAAANDHGHGVYRFTNNDNWAIDPAALRAKGCNLDRVVNDFEASAWGVTNLPDDGAHVVRAGRARPDMPLAVLGPGTGLGLAYALPLPGGAWRMQGTHGGHMMAAALTDEHHLICELVGRLNGGTRTVVVEDCVSGRGLPVLYRAVCMMLGDDPLPLDHAEDVLNYADNENAAHCLRLFHEFLGLFMHNVVTTLNAYGGVYLDGGLAAHLHGRGLFQSDRVLEFMTLNPVLPVRRDLDSTPVKIVNDPYVALRGLIAMDRNGG